MRSVKEPVKKSIHHHPVRISAAEAAANKAVINESISFLSSGANIKAVLKGYPYNILTSLAHEMSIPSIELAFTAGIAKTTLSRRKEGRLKKEESERIYNIGSTFELAVKVLGSTENAQIWFKTPQAALDSSTPLDYMKTLPGADAVKELLNAMEYGNYL